MWLYRWSNWLRYVGTWFAPPHTPDFSGKVGLNLALGLVTSCCSCQTAWWRPACCGVGPRALVTPIKAIRVGVGLLKIQCDLSNKKTNHHDLQWNLSLHAFWHSLYDLVFRSLKKSGVTSTSSTSTRTSSLPMSETFLAFYNSRTILSECLYQNEGWFTLFLKRAIPGLFFFIFIFSIHSWQ